MPTISDLISIKLNFDQAAFAAGLQDASRQMDRAKRTLEQQGADLERIAKNVGYGLEKVVAGVAGFFGLVLTFEGFKNLTIDAAQAGTTMGRFAESLGKTVEQTQAYQQAFKAFGGGETGILATIRQMKLDLSAYPQVYTDWMRQVEMLTGKTVRGKEPEQILQDISDAAARRKMDAAHLEMWLKNSLPLTPADVLLLSKPGELQKGIEEQRKKVGTPTTQQAEAMERLQADITNLETLNELLKLQALTLLEPFLHKLITTTMDAVNWLRSVAKMLGMTQVMTSSTSAVLVPGGGVPLSPGGSSSLVGGGGRSELFTGTSRTRFNPGTGRFETSTVPLGGGGRGGPSGGKREQLGVEAEDLPWVRSMQGSGAPSLSEARKGLMDEMNSDPATKEAVLARMESEVGNQDRDVQQGWLETTVNRALSRRMSLKQAVDGHDGYFGGSQPRTPSEYVKSGFGKMSADVAAGSNIAKYGTGNWSGPQGRGFGQSKGGYQTYGGTMGGGPASSYISGTSEQRSDVDIRLQAIMAAAAKHLPPGYTIRSTSGYRPGSAGYHSLHLAEDFQIYDPNGNPIPNRGLDTTGLYETLARHAYGEMLATHPELKGTFTWGGNFETSAGSGEADLMHFDLGGERGHHFRPSLEQLGVIPGERYGAAAAARSFDDNRPKVENNESSTHVNQIIVNTHATDASGIAKDVKDEIGKQLGSTSSGGGSSHLELQE